MNHRTALFQCEFGSLNNDQSYRGGARWTRRSLRSPASMGARLQWFLCFGILMGTFSVVWGFFRPVCPRAVKRHTHDRLIGTHVSVRGCASFLFVQLSPGEDQELPRSRPSRGEQTRKRKSKQTNKQKNTKLCLQHKSKPLRTIAFKGLVLNKKGLTVF